MTAKTPPLAALGGLLLLGVMPAACTPTVTVDVKPITIYAKLDADVRLRLHRQISRLGAAHGRRPNHGRYRGLFWPS